MTDSETEIRRASLRVHGMADPELDFQLLRFLGLTHSGGTAVGECLQVARKIAEGDLESWRVEWSLLGRALSDAAGKSPDRTAKRDLLCRASMAFLAAEIFSSKPQHNLESRDLFQRACPLFDRPIEILDLPGYFIQPKDKQTKRPTLLILGGFDSSGEELYFQWGFEALRRGHNVLIFEGPGQVGMRRLDPTSTFEPDWETPVGQAIDFALRQECVDPRRIALMGISFGGHFALRAAVHESRLHALILNSPVTNLHDYVMAFFPPNLPDFTLEELLAEDPDEGPASMQALCALLFNRFGTHSFYGLKEKLSRFTLSPKEVSQVTCPTLALVADGEGAEPVRQAKALKEWVDCPLTTEILEEEPWGANTHCGVSNLRRTNQIILDWLSSQS